MSADYRLMRAEEAREVLALWCRSPDDLEYQLARFATDPDPYAHTFVAVASDGTVLSTLHERVSTRHDAAGIPRRVGEIGSVATPVETRRQGHASRLLLLALGHCRARAAPGRCWSPPMRGGRSTSATAG
jgi:ribosomal protein S18 acetylase RimI-like enzyme